jgi:hypothetical protein
MPNQSGNVYGLTILSPIVNGADGDISHDCAIRDYLADLPRDHRSLFAKVSSTHLARLVVMDDVVFVGTPAREEHLQSKYLVFETNFDGDLDTYLTRMAREAPDEVHAVWRHCVGYPGVRDPAAFADYMKKCQIETTYFFADVNNKTVQQTLRALKVQSGLAHFIEANQGKPADEIQAAFRQFVEKVRHAPEPLAGEYEGHPHPPPVRGEGAEGRAEPPAGESEGQAHD